MSSWLISLINLYILYNLQIFDLEACLILKNKMASTAIFLVISKDFYTFEGPRGKGIIDFSNMQNIVIITKPCLGIFVVSF